MSYSNLPKRSASGPLSKRLKLQPTVALKCEMKGNYKQELLFP